MKKTHRPRLKVLAASTALALAFGAEAVTLTVTTNAFSGPGSLSSALATIQADTGCVNGPYIVNFSTGGPTTIATPAGFPTISCPTTIDGFDQAVGSPTGATPNTIGLARNGSNAALRVVIDANTMTGGNLFTLSAGAAGSVIRGLALQNYPTGSTAIQNAANNVSIVGNYIGVSTSGLACAAKAGTSGVTTLFGAVTNIGSANAADRNIIGCHTNNGINLAGPGNVVKGNLIGVGADGAANLGNPGALGILATANTQTIGGQAAGDGNVIAYNLIGVGFANFNGVVVSGNDMFLNTQLGIDVGNDGATPPNTNLFPSGPNGGQNYPTIISVGYSALDTAISGTMRGFSNTTTGLEFFDNTPLLGLDEGNRYAGSGSVFVGTPPAAFSVTIPGVVRSPTATASASSGTSEFSGAFPLTPSVASVNFGSTPVGVASAVQVVSIANLGPAPLSLSGIALSTQDFLDTTGGAPPNAAHWCGIGSDAIGAPLVGPTSTPIASGGSCTLNLVYVPQSGGAAIETITLSTTEAPSRSLTFELQGAGTTVPPGVTLGFAPTAVGLSAPSTLTLTVSNPNAVPTFADATLAVNLPPGLVVAAIPAAVAAAFPCQGGFSPVPVAGATSFGINGLLLPTSGSCAYSIDVSSATGGVYSVQVPANAVLFSDIGAANAASNTATLAVNSAALSVSPATAGFGSVSVSSTAGPLPITLTNTGLAALNFSAPFTIAGANAADFSSTTTCVPLPLPSLAPGNSCTLNLSFTPSAVGARSASIALASNDPASPANLAITGTGVATPVPVASLTPASITFPTQTAGTTSGPQVATLANTGTAPLNITSIITSGDFAQSNACGASLAPAASCAISVTFTPVLAGLRTGDVRVFDDAAGSPHAVTLSGNATAPLVPTVSAPASVTFPPTQVGGVSPPTSITISNTGAAPLQITLAQVVSGGYTIVGDTCTGATIALSGSCVFSVTFAPVVAGANVATLRFFSNAPTSPTYVTLTGTGTAAAVGTLSAAPAALSFGTQVVGTTTAAQPIAVSNVGSAPVTISAVTVSGDYAQANNCGTLASGNACTVSVTFTPTLTGSRAGSLSIASDASNSPLSVTLSGAGSPTPAPVIELSVASLSYGNRVMGTGSTPQPITLRNVGGADLAISRIYTTGDFTLAHNCPSVVAPQGSCRLDVGFLASVPGQRAGKVIILSNAQGGTSEAQLAGTGCRFFSVIGNRTGTLLCR